MKTQVIEISMKTSPFLQKGRCFFSVILLLFCFSFSNAQNSDVSKESDYSSAIYAVEGTTIYGANNISSEVNYVKRQGKLLQKHLSKKRENYLADKKVSAKTLVKNDGRKITSAYQFTNTNTEKLSNSSHDHFSSAAPNSYYSCKAVLKDFFIKWQTPLDYTNSTYQYFKYLKSISYQARLFTRPPPCG